MASHPPAQCCTVGVKHEGEHTGTSIKIEDKIEAYVAEPTGNTIHKDVALLILPDVIGIWKNSQLITDQFAANGYYTVMLDLFNGDAMTLNRPASFDLMDWMTNGTGGKNPHTSGAVDPIIAAGIKYLQDKGYKKIGAVGYCFGAKYVTRFLASGKGLSVGYVAHPSFVTEDELKAITGPFSIAAAETDDIFSVDKRHASEAMLITTKQPYQINLYSGVSHGFAVRGDMSVPILKFGKEQAFYQAVAWFDMWLKVEGGKL